MNLLALQGAPTEHLGGGEIATRFGVVLFLVALNAFFVAAEFSLVAVRRSRIDEMAENGDSGAKNVQRALEHLDRYIAGTQLGITIASLALGWVGEPAIAVIIDGTLGIFGIPPAPEGVHSGIALAFSFFLLTFLHIVLGELAPKSVALLNPEGVSKLVATPLRLFSQVMAPLIWIFNGAANGMLRLFGIAPSSEVHTHSPDELRLLVMQARAHGTLDESDSAMLAGVFDFHEKKARDVMRPRTDVVALSADATEDEVWKIIREERYSRYPVYRESLDDVIGVFLAKDLWLHESAQPFSLAEFTREPLYVPDSRPAEKVLDDLRRTRAHMAVVLDEYGGTAGIITMEDLIEEVIGDISDEYDLASRTAIEANGMLELDGTMSLIDVRSDHRVQIPEGDWTTLGGYAFAKLGRLPKMGDRVAVPGGELEVIAMDGRRIAALRVHRAHPTPPGGAAETQNESARK
ncbi:MAG TPA: hemolysin family protein [Gemmatimonadaceae bacterium]|nr:hemolysin family protein [Gemmatimonadaceae bacterium]